MKNRPEHGVGVANRKAAAVLPLLTDLIFVCIAAYLILSYVRAMFVYSASSLFLIRYTFFLAFTLSALILLAVRRRATAFASRKTDFVYTVIGFSAPVFFQFTPYAGSVFAGVPLELIGLTLVVTALLSLNRSFGLAPENRGVKIGGVYRLVRHPMYLGYILSELGFVFDNFSNYNLLVFFISVLFLVMRLRAEERLLREDPAYRKYAASTRWRLLPLVY